MSKRPNILWLMADQMRADCMGCAGHGIARTPNLDALAARGVRFDNAFVQGPICAPSRMSWFTSRYVRSHGAWWNGIPPRQGLSSLPRALRAAGYETRQIGKLHFWPTDEDHGFDRRERHEEALPTEQSAYDAFLRAQSPPAKHPAQATEWDASAPRACGIGVCTMPEELEETRWLADRVGAFLAEPHERPFFCYASFIRPHSPYNPLQRFLDLYRAAPVEAPPFDPREWDRVPPRVRALAACLGFDRHRPEHWREIRRHYYALVSQVDEHVGRILAALERAGLAEDTIVVFSSDHGDFVGEHGIGHKMHLWDGSLRVPLIVSVPGGPRGRRGCLVESIDLAPALLDLVGVPQADGFEGRSLLPALADERAPHRDEVFAEYVHHTMSGSAEAYEAYLDACVEHNSVCVRTADWKYIHYVGEPGELYDLRRDPLERDNLFGRPERAAVQADLQRRLLDWQTRFAHCGFALPPRDMAYFRNGRAGRLASFGRARRAARITSAS